MPTRAAVLTPTEVLLAREACAPLLNSVTDRLLRSGLAGFADFRRRFVGECQRAMSVAAGKKPNNGNSSVASSSPASASSSFAASPSLGRATASSKVEGFNTRTARRINPEGLKDVFAQCGVIFTPEEFRSILIAYSDAVGFVLAEDLLADLHPCRRAPLDLIHTCTAAVVEGLFAELPLVDSPAAGGGDSKSDFDFPAAKVDSVCAALRMIFDPTLSKEEEEGEGNGEAGRGSHVPSSAAAADRIVAALTSLQAGVEATSTNEVYPEGAVPAEDVVAFVILALQQHPQVTALVLTRLRNAPSLVPALSPSRRDTIGGGGASASSSTTTRNGTNTKSGGAGGTLDGSALFSIRHRGVTTQRKFEYYCDSVDRRDEWMRGRQENDARPNYLRHAVGYGGHLPEYQYRFGRTFHVIEEDLPQLTKPKAPLEPVPADWYGEGVELKDSRMNAHHYRLA